MLRSPLSTLINQSTFLPQYHVPLAVASHVLRSTCGEFALVSIDEARMAQAAKLHAAVPLNVARFNGSIFLGDLSVQSGIKLAETHAVVRDDPNEYIISLPGKDGSIVEAQLTFSVRGNGEVYPNRATLTMSAGRFVDFSASSWTPQMQSQLFGAQYLTLRTRGAFVGRAEIVPYQPLVAQETLEVRLQRMPVQASPVFLKKGQLRPVTFVPMEGQLEQTIDSAVLERFPRTSKNQLLDAGAANGVPVEGLSVGVLFSGGPAPAGHNVVAGLQRMLGPKNELYGIKNGPGGLIAGDMDLLTDEKVASYVNMPGFDLLGTDRTKIETQEQFRAVKDVCRERGLNAIVVIGGDDSNTNAALLAEYLKTGVHADGSGVQVVGVPKTIDGDLQLGDLLPISFGYHTATVEYARQVASLLRDSKGSNKYWHFVKLMGRSASQVALEVALLGLPNITLIGEEVAAKEMSLRDVVDSVVTDILRRRETGKDYGVVVIPEGLIEFIPEMHALIKELNVVVSSNAEELAGLASEGDKRRYARGQLTEENERLLKSLPRDIQNTLIKPRDSHGNLKVSGIPTEELIMGMVKERIDAHGDHQSLQAKPQFFGYAGRGVPPTQFDRMLGFNLGATAASILMDPQGLTGYMASLSMLHQGGRPIAIPLVPQLTEELRKGKRRFVIEKALVDLKSPAFLAFAAQREENLLEDCLTCPDIDDASVPLSVALNRGYVV